MIFTWPYFIICRISVNCIVFFLQIISRYSLSVNFLFRFCFRYIHYYFLLKNLSALPSRFSYIFSPVTRFKSSCFMSSGIAPSPFFFFLQNLRSFWDCKGKNLFVISKKKTFYFFFSFYPAFKLFIAPFAGCKGKKVFRFSKFYLKIIWASFLIIIFAIRLCFWSTPLSLLQAKYALFNLHSTF